MRLRNCSVVFHKWYGIVFGAKAGKQKIFLGGESMSASARRILASGPSDGGQCGGRNGGGPLTRSESEAKGTTEWRPGAVGEA